MAETIAVVGAGAIGAFFAAHLVAAGHDVTVCVRQPFEELVVDSEEPLRVTPTAVVTDPAALAGTTVDWVLLATKAHQSEGARGWLDALVGPDTKVVVLQNGVEHEQRIRPLLPEHGKDAEIVPAVVYCGAEVLEPGHIVHRSSGFLIVPDGPTGRALEALYEGSRAGIRPTDDFATAVWQKLCSNVTANGLTALTMRRMEVFRREDIADVARLVIAECLACAVAEGASVDPGYGDLLIAGVAAMPEDSGTSMLYDRLAGRPTEHDALYGAVSRAGRRRGIPTPMHDTIGAILAALSEGPPTT